MNISFLFLATLLVFFFLFLLISIRLYALGTKVLDIKIEIPPYLIIICKIKYNPKWHYRIETLKANYQSQKSLKSLNPQFRKTMCREKPCQPRLKKPIQIDMSYGNTFGTRKRFSLFILMNDFVKKKKAKKLTFYGQLHWSQIL